MDTTQLLLALLATGALGFLAGLIAGAAIAESKERKARSKQRSKLRDLPPMPSEMPSMPYGEPVRPEGQCWEREENINPYASAEVGIEAAASAQLDTDSAKIVPPHEILQIMDARHLAARIKRSARENTLAREGEHPHRSTES